MNNVLILVFDEHPLIRYAVKNLIVKRGWQFLDTGCQKKTLKLISTYKPNLIILDILMQGCLGLNYIKKIRQLSPTSKVLVFSSLLPTFFIKRCLEIDVNGYVYKKDALYNLDGAIDAVLTGHCCFPDIDVNGEDSRLPLGMYYHEE
ncbi:TPA: response regulator transcription factor [Yersinia enterocolitica]